MIRLGLLIAASIAAYAARQVNVKNSTSSASTTRPSGILLYQFDIYHFFIGQLKLEFISTNRDGDLLLVDILL